MRIKLHDLPEANYPSLDVYRYHSETTFFSRAPLQGHLLYNTNTPDPNPTTETNPKQDVTHEAAPPNPPGPSHGTTSTQHGQHQPHRPAPQIRPLGDDDDGAGTCDLLLSDCATALKKTTVTDENGGGGSVFELWREWDEGDSTFVVVSSFGSCAVRVALLNGTNAM